MEGTRMGGDRWEVTKKGGDEEGRGRGWEGVIHGIHLSHILQCED